MTTAVWGTIRRGLIDAPDSPAQKARRRRWQRLADTFPDLAEMSVVDLGGRPSSWAAAPLRPAHVHVVNVEPPEDDLPSWVSAEHGDACTMADRPERYDLVFSNAVLEHVGGHERRERFADAVHHLADRHWVQTPYRYFPLEPHWLFPGFQHLPVAARVWVARHWGLAKAGKIEDRAEALSEVLFTDLVSLTEMRHYFPRSVIEEERVAGLVKSIIAVRA